MINRRQLVGTTAAAAALPALPLSPAWAAEAPEAAAASFQRLVTSKLISELQDMGTAQTLAPLLVEVGFNWSLPLIAGNQVNAIVAYAFGNRPNAASGNTSSGGGNQAALPDPGPINELLADEVFKLFSLNPVHVFAQWEIARFLVSKYGMTPEQLHSIEPVTNADGTITYLSTDGVAAAVVALVGGAANLGKVAVFGHRDHAKRCVQTSQARGMNAFVAREVTLPVVYDALSGQPWTRNRHLYVLHDMYAQLFIKALSLTAQAYPQG